MPTNPYTQADIDALRAKIARFAGVKATSFGDQSTTFDLEGARALLQQMEAEVSQVAGTRTKTRYAAFSKGL